KVTNLSDGGVNNFTGNVVPGAKRCCDLEISWTKPHEVTKIRGTLCKQGEKLQGKGTFTSQYDQTSCTGEWTMEK
ncbi:MAG TPA: hypothetical protein VLA75_12855, partial [Thermoanaerobaculia bacterium]|nr:hypothetical protein [Thermoanaerobaculia bacterium]